ncbi:MAG: hypothetical protein AAF705_06220 [Bacteroidota bacterium]
MKKQPLLLFATFLMLSFVFTSCTEDDPFGVDPGLSPSIRLLDGTGVISSSVSAEVGETLRFRVNASAGDDPLELLTIQENGQNVALSRITFENGSPFGSNPASILGATEKQGFTQDIEIEGPAAAGNYSYTFIIRDEAQVTANTGITVTVELTPPMLSIIAPNSPTEAGSGSIITLGLDATRGTAGLSTIAVYENDTLIAADRLAYNDNSTITNFIENPEFTPAVESFQTGLNIRIAEVPDSVTYTYRVDLTDTEGITASATLEVLVTNSIDTAYTGILVYNRDGQQFGGLNLYTGQAVAFNSADAQIRDLGIDINLSAANNWIQRIRAVNAAELRVPGANQVEGFSFTNTNTRDALITAFNNGETVSGNSDVVAVGDVFLVKNNEDYFILEVTEIVVTATDNNDYYEFSIKKSCQ